MATVEQGVVEWGPGWPPELLACCGVLGAAGGAPPDLCPPYTGLFQHMVKSECRFINGTDQVRFMVRFSYNPEQLLHLDSKVGHCMGDTLYGEKQARCWNTVLG